MSDLTPVELLRWVRHACTTEEAKRLRIEAQLTQEEIAQAVGVTGPTISRWEDGVRRPSGDAALLYARLIRPIELEPGETEIAVDAGVLGSAVTDQLGALIREQANIVGAHYETLLSHRVPEATAAELTADLHGVLLRRLFGRKRTQ